MLNARSYAYDVDPQTQRFLNRRTFLWADTGIPDGFQADSNGNIYASTADGVQASFSFVLNFICKIKSKPLSFLKVYDPNGILLGKIFIGSNSANNVFAGNGRMVIMAETKMVLVKFAANGSLVELT